VEVQKEINQGSYTTIDSVLSFKVNIGLEENLIVSCSDAISI
jgi:hypothetical protein